MAATTDEHARSIRLGSVAGTPVYLKRSWFVIAAVVTFLAGPTVQREIQLWVEAGVPAAVALQAATGNAARVIGAGNRLGLVKPGYEATLLILDGNPLADPGANERISGVIYKGGRVPRAGLFDQK